MSEQSVICTCLLNVIEISCNTVITVGDMAEQPSLIRSWKIIQACFCLRVNRRLDYYDHRCIFHDLLFWNAKDAVLVKRGTNSNSARRVPSLRLMELIGMKYFGAKAVTVIEEHFSNFAISPLEASFWQGVGNRRCCRWFKNSWCIATVNFSLASNRAHSFL